MNKVNVFFIFLLFGCAHDQKSKIEYLEIRYSDLQRKIEDLNRATMWMSSEIVKLNKEILNEK